MSTDFNLRSPAVLISNKKISLFFEALKPVIDFSSLAMEVLDGCPLPQKAAWSTLKNSLLLYHLKVITWITALSNSMKL